MHKGTIWVMAAVLLMSMPAAFAQTISLPQTGETSCYDENGNAIACAGTGQDGDIQAGVPWPSPRFTDNGDGTLTDNLTGLMWLKDANCFKTHYAPDDTDGASDGAVTWQHALDFVRYINIGANSVCGAGHNDWRLPNINELESLLNADAATGLGNLGFTNVQTQYWSSTSTVESPYQAWTALMGSDVISFSFKYLVSEAGYILPVRGVTTSSPAPVRKTGQSTCYDENGKTIACAGTGQDGEIQAGVSWPSPRFTDNSDGTVTDNLTGLIWLKNADCFNSLTWTQGLSSANNLADGNCGLNDGSAAGDWRLPNITELTSLLDYGQYFPGLPSNHPFINVQGGSAAVYYWSSTSSALLRDAAKIGDMGGTVGTFAYNKYPAYTSVVWPVKAGAVGTFYTLNIWNTGTGSGTVTSSPTGINLKAGNNAAFASFTPNTVVKLTATPDADSTFVGWGGDAECSTGTVTMNSARNCTAVFNLISPHDITPIPYPSTDGTVSCSPNPVGHGSTSICTITGNAGYSIKSVGGDCGGNLNGNIYTTDPITADCNVIAIFEANSNQYNITIIPYPASGGSASCTPNPVIHNATSTCTITTNPGYSLQSVGGCGGNLNGNTYTTNPITADCNLIPIFTKQHTITASANPAAGGSVSCSPNPVNNGSTSTCIISVGTGYTLQEIGGTCGGALKGGVYITNPITADCTVQANFKNSSFPWSMFLPAVTGRFQ